MGKSYGLRVGIISFVKAMEEHVATGYAAGIDVGGIQNENSNTS
jgi:hypothetical protein